MIGEVARNVRIPAALVAAIVAASACSFDRSDRWITAESEGRCEIGAERCRGTNLERCVDDSRGARWETTRSCGRDDLVCVPGLFECLSCVPGTTRCDGHDVERCADDGSGMVHATTCDAEGTACRAGSCVHLCGQARAERSNVGCEYWAVDLDNANIDASTNAAAQQFAVVVSNPQPDLPANVTIELDDTDPGTEGDPQEIVRATVPPFSLEIFRLGPREVDGSPPGEFDTGTHTALSRNAYRLRATVPIVAYQFNPLENANVFSNDASLLKPVEALVGQPGTMEDAYVVMGWPQTIASTDDPNTNFSARNPKDLRAFLTVVGTRPDTTVRVTLTARTLEGDLIAAASPGETIEHRLDPFDVLNLETDDFNADFTGSVIAADRPVVVFSGNEASDAPFFERISERACCADHLEEQLDPIRTSGRRFVATISPNRARAIGEAGVDVGTIVAPEYFRILAVTDAGARVLTTLPPPNDELTIAERGRFVDVTATEDFLIESDEPVTVASVSPSQDAAGIPTRLPGGDPSLLILPPVEQYRSSYVFLTPDRYSFDFVRIVAPPRAWVRLDGQDVTELSGCTERPIRGFDRETAIHVVRECQLSFPALDGSLGSNDPLDPGRQNDGVHEVLASEKVGVLVDGFDRNVSYAYAAGTELVEIIAR